MVLLNAYIGDMIRDERWDELAASGDVSAYVYRLGVDTRVASKNRELQEKINKRNSERIVSDHGSSVEETEKVARDFSGFYNPPGEKFGGEEDQCEEEGN